MKDYPYVFLLLHFKQKGHPLQGCKILSTYRPKPDYASCQTTRNRSWFVLLTWVHWVPVTSSALGPGKNWRLNLKWQYFRNNILYKLLFGTKNGRPKLTVLPKRRCIRCRCNRNPVYILSRMPWCYEPIDSRPYASHILFTFWHFWHFVEFVLHSPIQNGKRSRKFPKDSDNVVF